MIAMWLSSWRTPDAARCPRTSEKWDHFKPTSVTKQPNFKLTFSVRRSYALWDGSSEVDLPQGAKHLGVVMTLACMLHEFKSYAIVHMNQYTSAIHVSTRMVCPHASFVPLGALKGCLQLSTSKYGWPPRSSLRGSAKTAYVDCGGCCFIWSTNTVVVARCFCCCSGTLRRACTVC